MDVNDKRIYLSGPITGMPDLNVAAFAVAQHRLREAGAEFVYNPTQRAMGMRASKRGQMTHDEWMVDCLHELTDRKKRSQGWEEVIPKKYDMLVLLDGWRESVGARAEHDAAVACGIEVCELSEVLDG